MTETNDQIPTVETYRGVGIHDFQPRQRIDAVVKPAIDVVHGMSDPAALAACAGDIGNPPEARLFAAAKVRAAWEMAAENRENRPPVDLQLLQAVTAGLGSRHWMHPFQYGSLLDAPDAPGEHRAVAREIPLSDEQRGRGK